MVIIHTALLAEAQPLINALGLKKHHNHGNIVVYTHAEEPLCLIISGVGSHAAATAIGYGYAKQCADHHAQIINIGIAGGEFEIGSLFKVNKIYDQVSNRCYYPHLGIEKIPSVSCYTVLKPQDDYQADIIYDMESSGFFTAANQFVNVEQILLLKIISDNSSAPTTKVDKALVNKLIMQNINTLLAQIKQCLQQSRDAQQEHEIVKHMPLFTQRWHCTVSQQLLLKERLSHIAIHQPSRNCWLECQNMASIKDVLQYLQTSFHPEALS